MWTGSLIYPDSPEYRSESIGISFPENWLGKVAIHEIEDGLTVYFREAAETAPVLASGKAVVFAVVSADKNDETALRNYSDEECFTFITESGGKLYYLSNNYGSTGAMEIYFSDLWKANEKILTEMKAAVLSGDIIGRITIFD